MDDIESILEEFASLKNDWDSYGGSPFDPSTIKEARPVCQVVSKFFNNILDSSHFVFIVPMPSGHVDVEVHGPNHLELNFTQSGNGSFHILPVIYSENDISCVTKAKLKPKVLQDWLIQNYGREV